MASALRNPSMQIARAFTTNSRTKLKGQDKALAKLHSQIPPYPYGPSRWYKQSNKGLYGGTHISFGNSVSEKFEIKNRRTWKPNVHKKRLWSKSLNKWIRIRVTTRALRTIDKCGGLDEYLLGDKPARVKELGMGGWLLRWRIMQTPEIKKRFEREREKLGVPKLEEEIRVLEARRLAEEAKQREIEELDDRLDKADREGHEVADFGEENDCRVPGEVLERPRPFKEGMATVTL